MFSAAAGGGDGDGDDDQPALQHHPLRHGGPGKQRNTPCCRLTVISGADRAVVQGRLREADLQFRPAARLGGEHRHAVGQRGGSCRAAD